MQDLEVARRPAEAPQYLAPSTSTMEPAASVMTESPLAFTHCWIGSCGFGPPMTAVEPKGSSSPVARSSCLVHS